MNSTEDYTQSYKAIIEEYPIFEYTIDTVYVMEIATNIKENKILPHLPFVFDDLRPYFNEIDKHNPYYFHPNLLIAEKHEGFVYVNMDGFHSNLINENEIIQIWSWETLINMEIQRIEEDESTVLILQSNDGYLTLRDNYGESLFVVYSLYFNVFKDVIEEFKGKPTISWNIVENELGINMLKFNNWYEFWCLSETFKKDNQEI